MSETISVWMIPGIRIDKPEISKIIDAAIITSHSKNFIDLCTTRKVPKVYARYAAINLIIKLTKLNYREAAEIFGLDHSTAHHAKRIHKLKDERTKLGKSMHEQYMISWNYLTQKYIELRNQNLN